MMLRLLDDAILFCFFFFFIFFFQAEGGIRVLVGFVGFGDLYKRQPKRPWWPTKQRTPVGGRNAGGGARGGGGTHRGKQASHTHTPVPYTNRTLPTKRKV